MTSLILQRYTFNHAIPPSSACATILVRLLYGLSIVRACCDAGPQLLILSSRAASLHSASSTDMMLAEGFLDFHPGVSGDVESGNGSLQPLVTPSGMGAEMRCAAGRNPCEQRGF